MSWFKSDIDDRIKDLVSENVSAYVERSRLSYQLLTIEPRLTDIEAAVMWAGAAAAWAEMCSKESNGTDLGNAIRMTEWDFFLSFCQSYIEKVCHSTLKLDPDSTVIRKSITPTLEAMSRERRNRSGELFAALLCNAGRLAGATVLILSANLTKDQAKAANRYAISLIAKQSDLNPFERGKANEWVMDVSWAREPQQL